MDAGAGVAALVSSWLAIAAFTTETHVTPCPAATPSSVPSIVMTATAAALLVGGALFARLRGGSRLHHYLMPLFLFPTLAIVFALLQLPNGPPGCGD